MTQLTFQGTLKLRGGTAAAWTSANPTLALNEVGLETDTKKYKVGDGTTAWASLAYWLPSVGDLTQDSTHRFVTDTEKNTWNGKQDALGFTPEDVSNKSTDTSLGGESASNTLYPSQAAVKTYSDSQFAIKSHATEHAPGEADEITYLMPLHGFFNLPGMPVGGYVTYDDETRVFTLNKEVGGDNRFWVNGHLVSFETGDHKADAHADYSGTYYFVYDLAGAWPGYYAYDPLYNTINNDTMLVIAKVVYDDVSKTGVLTQILPKYTAPPYNTSETGESIFTLAAAIDDLRSRVAALE